MDVSFLFGHSDGLAGRPWPWMPSGIDLSLAPLHEMPLAVSADAHWAWRPRPRWLKWRGRGALVCASIFKN
ncbi:uncharacterized protein B0I36DRAFT_327533 [Microdochium trichocladiopsis]|uniref:Uncharacterized protein n=1 Tax=Microdochium trichocladiopsis TaxID=1682393 RepID=A0A9P8Y479_9PEZI|nr:uncharacterized protein B0I36DRAFT_327533 [Microdochium trichocladiopsis]KAH7027642.1 hypothetical protein B0I36DRAFT_327533 [Microdochium trichocladiopsis]